MLVFAEPAHTVTMYKDSNYQGLMIEGHNGTGNPYYSGLISSVHHNSPSYPTSAATITAQTGITFMIRVFYQSIEEEHRLINVTISGMSSGSSSEIHSAQNPQTIDMSLSNSCHGTHVWSPGLPSAIRNASPPGSHQHVNQMPTGNVLTTATSSLNQPVLHSGGGFPHYQPFHSWY